MNGAGAQLWTARERLALIAILSVLLVYLSIRYALNPTYVSNPQPDVPARAGELADRIDPNTADADTLAALPLLGEKRAKLVIDYRESFKRRFPGRIAFERPEDLMKIKGIGPATVEQLRAFLTFPEVRKRP